MSIKIQTYYAIILKTSEKSVINLYSFYLQSQLNLNIYLKFFLEILRLNIDEIVCEIHVFIFIYKYFNRTTNFLKDEKN